ncbi:MAG: formylglycine-generating enzyme family protein [Candidatus Hydrogenedentes bacterium]|nr:formylglycine-generating enzyme family protein [Candidatus Hydrogenedentota bacterium]
MKQMNRPIVLALVASSLALSTGCPSGGRDPIPGATRTFDGIEFQWCPPGTFAMGSPAIESGHEDDETLHEVTLTSGFWLSKHEITQSQWIDWIGENPSSNEGDDLPVENVTWEDVQDFLVVLNTAVSGATYRLPTEAEWEYACRAETTTRFYWGNDAAETEIDDNAWYSENSLATQPVGELEPNAWGLLDMSGNVMEWCQDKYGDYPSDAVTNPVGTDSGNSRVVRGGSYVDAALDCRTPNRDFRNPDVQLFDVGFRLLRTAD